MVDSSGMIWAQMGTHNTSENGAVHGTPCTYQPITVTSNKLFFPPGCVCGRRILAYQGVSEPIWVAARYKEWICGRLAAWIAGLNPAEAMAVCLLCLYVVLSYVDRGLCDGLITRPEESYCVYSCVRL
jgi:hypothetical protein